MNRDIFVRLATRALRQTQGLAPEQQAEAIALKMDELQELLGEVAPAAMQPKAAPPMPMPMPSAVFPPPDPQAVMPATDQVATATEGTPAPLIIPATTIPDNLPRPGQPAARPSAPPRRAPAPTMKVEELNLLVQEQTPPYLRFEVPMEDGTTQKTHFVRNVISQHDMGSVLLIYSPPSSLPSVREAAEVREALHVADTHDFAAVVQRLTQMAVDACRPRAIREVSVRPYSGPVQSQSAYPDGSSAAADSQALEQTQAVFRSTRV